LSYAECESLESKVNVSDKIPTTISISPQEVNVGVGQEVTFGGLLQCPTGPLANKRVYLVVEGEEVASAITDDSGRWSITYKFEKAGTYKVKATYKGE